jgi:hypothetical protein
MIVPDFKTEDCAVNAASTLGPVQDPVSGSDSQPLFSAAHPGFGASFS